MRLEEGHHLLIRVPAVELWVTVPDRLDQEHHVRLVVGEHGTRHGTHESPVLGVALLDHDSVPAVQPVADVQPDDGTPLHSILQSHFSITLLYLQQPTTRHRWRSRGPAERGRASIALSAENKTQP